ncbi:hypothetical protein MTO96_025423 [Rhipicephalus appendiculatus]
MRISYYASAYYFEDSDDELECDKRAAITCYWSIADRFGRSPFVSVSNEPDDYLTSFCEVSENSDEFPEDAACKDFYAGCSDADRNQFATMERGYAALQESATLADFCLSIQSLRECIDVDVMRKCEARRPPQAAAFDERINLRRRAAIQLKGCLHNAVRKCDSATYRSAIVYLKRIANSVVDLNSLGTKRDRAGNGAPSGGAVVVVLVTALLGGFVRTTFE